MLWWSTGLVEFEAFLQRPRKSKLLKICIKSKSRILVMTNNVMVRLSQMHILVENCVKENKFQHIVIQILQLSMEAAPSASTEVLLSHLINLAGTKSGTLVDNSPKALQQTALYAHASNLSFSSARFIYLLFSANKKVYYLAHIMVHTRLCYYKLLASSQLTFSCVLSFPGDLPAISRTDLERQRKVNMYQEPKHF